ncbi:hypothetical protein ACOI1H_16180 [Loktanella sp. DJP18]|uniref:hypothetical protein n=1 Tax=Loktanella sp. DJP18 TaxID=3409788 RepID=UPI003BB4EFAF
MNFLTMLIRITSTMTIIGSVLALDLAIVGIIHFQNAGYGNVAKVFVQLGLISLVAGTVAIFIKRCFPKPVDTTVREASFIHVGAPL